MSNYLRKNNNFETKGAVRLKTEIFDSKSQNPVNSILDAEKTWVRTPPVFLINLSDGQVQEPKFNSTITQHSKVLTTFQDTSVFGSHHFHAFLTSPNEIYLTETNQGNIERRLKSRSNFVHDNQANCPLISSENNNFFITYDHLDTGLISYVEEPCFFVSAIEPDNYGMWLLQTLPSIEYYINNFSNSKVFAWKRFDWQARLLEFMGVDLGNYLIQKPNNVFMFDRLDIIRYSKTDLIPTCSDLAFFERLRKKYGAEIEKGKRIFISRKSLSAKSQTGYRALLNEDELIEMLKKYNFDIVEPEFLSIEKQIHLFSTAEIVIGLGGAGLFNAVFCNPQALVVTIESSSNFIQNHANLFVGLGLKYGIVFGKEDLNDKREIHKKWRINVQELEKSIISYIY